MLVHLLQLHSTSSSSGNSVITTALSTRPLLLLLICLQLLPPPCVCPRNNRDARIPYEHMMENLLIQGEAKGAEGDEGENKPVYFCRECISKGWRGKNKPIKVDHTNPDGSPNYRNANNNYSVHKTRYHSQNAKPFDDEEAAILTAGYVKRFDVPADWVPEEIADDYVPMPIYLCTHEECFGTEEAPTGQMTKEKVRQALTMNAHKIKGAIKFNNRKDTLRNIKRHYKDFHEEESALYAAVVQACEEDFANAV